MNGTDPKLGGKVPPAVRVAGFGKHPAWSDHIEHLGTITPVLSKLEGELYLGAIGSLIISGDWPASSSPHPLAGVLRRFLWQAGPDLVYGWMWPSVDQVGRDHFPLLLCAHVTGCDAGTVVRRLDGLFRTAREGIQETKDRTEVTALITALGESCRRELSSAEPTASDYYTEQAERWNSDSGLDQAGWRRLLYFLKTQYADAGIVEVGTRMMASRPRKTGGFEAMRLPLPAASDATAGLVSWLAWLRSQLTAETPLLLVGPEGLGWCDVSVGTITTDSMKPIVAPADQVYPVTDVPYEISAEFAADAEHALSSVGKKWGDPDKHTIFGMVPSRYRPALPVWRTDGASPGSNEPKPTAERVASVESSRPRKRSGGTGASWGWVIAGGVGVLLVALLLGWWLFGRKGGGTASPGGGTSVKPVPPTVAAAETASVVDASDVTGKWLQYWKNYRQLGVLTTNGPTQAYWAGQVITNLGGLDRGAWDPWTVVFGGPLPGADINTLASGKLRGKEESAKLQRGSQAAAQLMAAATNGYSRYLRSRLNDLANTPASGLIAGLGGRLGGMPDADGLVTQVRSLARIEEALDRVSEDLRTWSDGWAGLVQVDPMFPSLIRSNEVRRLGAEIDVGPLLAKVAESAGAAKAGSKWAGPLMPNIDRDYLSKSLAQPNAVTDLKGWSNAVSQAERLVPISSINQLADRLTGAETTDRLKELLDASKKDGEPYRVALDKFNRDLGELRGKSLVRGNPADVDRFQAFSNEVTAGLTGLKESWGRATTRAGMLASFRGKPEVGGFTNEWNAYLTQEEQKARQKPVADEHTAALQMRDTLDKARLFFAGLDRSENLKNLMVPPETYPESEWRMEVRDAVIRAGSGFQGSAAGAVESVELPVQKLRAGIQASSELRKAWEQGAWTDTTGFRSGISNAVTQPGFTRVREKFGLDQWNRLAGQTWSPATADALVEAVPGDSTGLSAVCERLDRDPDWPKTDAQWKKCCLLAQGALRTEWKQAPQHAPQQAWFQRQWKKRMASVTTAPGLPKVVGPVVEARLDGWLSSPLPFPLHRALANLVSAIEQADLVTAGRNAGQVLEVLGNGNGAGAGGTADLVSQIRVLKRAPKVFDRTDWAGLEKLVGGKVILDGAKQEATVPLGAGITQVFKLVDGAENAGVLVAKTELSAGQLAVLLNDPRNVALRLSWARQTVDRVPVTRRTKADGAIEENPVAIWNNLADDLRPGGMVAPTERFPAGSRYRGKSGLEGLSATGPDLPANCLSARFALDVAVALHCRLATKSEWESLTRALPVRSFPCRPKKAQDTLKTAAFYDDPDRDFPVHPLSGTGGPETAGGAVDFFQAVTASEGDPAGVQNWFGNVAEYLFDPTGNAFSLAGGSFASGRTEPQPVGDPGRALVDAGLRLALDRRENDDLARARELVAQIKVGP